MTRLQSNRDKERKSAKFTYTHTLYALKVCNRWNVAIDREEERQRRETDKKVAFDENVAKHTHHRCHLWHCRLTSNRGNSGGGGGGNKWIWIEMWIYKRHRRGKYLNQSIDVLVWHLIHGEFIHLRWFGCAFASFESLAAASAHFSHASANVLSIKSKRYVFEAKLQQ